MGHNSSNFKLWKSKPGSEMHHIWGQKLSELKDYKSQLGRGMSMLCTAHTRLDKWQLSEMHDISHTSAWSTIRHVLEWNPRRNEDAVTYS